MEIKQKEERGITELLGGKKSASRKRDGLNQTRQSSQPAQQELPLFIYINPTDVFILPAPSQMLNLNLTHCMDLYLPDRTADRPTVISCFVPPTPDTLTIFTNLDRNQKHTLFKDEKLFLHAESKKRR